MGLLKLPPVLGSRLKRPIGPGPDAGCSNPKVRRDQLPVRSGTGAARSTAITGSIGTDATMKGAMNPMTIAGNLRAMCAPVHFLSYPITDCARPDQTQTVPTEGY